MNSISVPNSLYPDQARHYVGPDLVPNCLQRLSVSTSSGGGGGLILPTRLGGPIFSASALLFCVWCKNISCKTRNLKGPLTVVMGITVYRCLLF